MYNIDFLLWSIKKLYTINGYFYFLYTQIYESRPT